MHYLWLLLQCQQLLKFEVYSTCTEKSPIVLYVSVYVYMSATDKKHCKVNAAEDRANGGKSICDDHIKRYSLRTLRDLYVLVSQRCCHLKFLAEVSTFKRLEGLQKKGVAFNAQGKEPCVKAEKKNIL